MATPVTDAFIAQIRGAATIMGGVQVDAMADAAKVVKPIMVAAVVSMAGPDMALSNNVTKSGKPKGAIRVQYDVRDHGADGASVLFRATGPIALIEKGAGAHTIAPRRSRRGRRRGAMQGGGYDHPYSGVIRHPGSRGKGRWAAARDSEVPAAARAVFLGRNVLAFRKAFT